MQRKIAWIAMALMLVSVAAVAQVGGETSKGDLVGTRLGPENFRVQGGAGAVCFSVPTSIPDNDPGGVTTTLMVDTGCGAITDLDFSTQISHTWVGDLKVVLTKSGGPSATLIDQPGVPASTFGCSGDDIDATLNDEARSDVETECAAGVPTIQGDFVPGDPAGPALSAFDGEDFCGLWELNVNDNAGGDLGTVFEWCIFPGTTGGTDTVVPASNSIGIALMVVLLLGSSAYFVRRRVMN
jgi:subtilisin-like proprotein convertase family protein